MEDEPSGQNIAINLSDNEVDDEDMSPSKEKNQRKRRMSIEVDISELIENLSKINGYETLSIKEFVEDYHSDPVVKEYVDILLETKTPPFLLQDSVSVEWLNHNVHTNFPTNKYCDLIKNFMSVSQIRYFQNNLKGATENDVALCNVKYDLKIPKFNHLPSATFTKMKQVKQSFANQMQGVSALHSEFSRELLLLKNNKIICDFLRSNNFSSKEEQNKEFQFIFATAFSKARLEYEKEATTKTFVWTERESRIRDVIPKWRKDKVTQPPTEPYNRLAIKIEDRILKGQEDFNGLKLKSDLEAFIKDGSIIKKKLKTTPKNNNNNHTSTSTPTSNNRNTGNKKHKSNNNPQNKNKNNNKIVSTSKVVSTPQAQHQQSSTSKSNQNKTFSFNQFDFPSFNKTPQVPLMFQ